MCILGDLNGWIEDRIRAGITGAFEVSGENNKAGREKELCGERGLCVGTTYFEHRSLHKCTRLARSQDGVEVKGMIDLVLVKKDMLHYVRAVRNGTRCFRSEITMMHCKVRLV